MEAEKVGDLLLARKLLKEHEQQSQTVVERPVRSYIAGESYPERFADLERLVKVLCPNPIQHEGNRIVKGNTPELSMLAGRNNGPPVKLKLYFSFLSDTDHSVVDHHVSATWSLMDSDQSDDTYDEVLVEYEENEAIFAHIDWSMTQYLETIGQMSQEQLVEAGFPTQYIEDLIEARSLPPF